MRNDSTLVINNIKAALASAENEANKKNAALLVVGGVLNGTLFDLAEGTTSIGRSPENNVILDFDEISRKHLKIQVKADVVLLIDEESRNGTYLNNAKVVGAAKLKKGDMVKVGKICLKFIPTGDLERLTYDKLRHDANTDGLTRCYNKTFFNKSFDIEVKKSNIVGKPLSLIIFDLDNFKKLNDNFGHDAGDYVLKTMAQIIRDNGVRERDIFARYGGEEFAILLPNTNLMEGYAIAERLRILIEKHPFLYDNKRLYVTASIGIA
ncbi:MAG: GGDEF domain-containing protein, partial [Planctomycetes bacterium]|nr:GGDEF domain-containing protein [Planctomycetota bacterium]